MNTKQTPEQAAMDLQIEDMVRFSYPDTDYPIGHPSRVWGVLATCKTGAIEFIEQQMMNGVITQSESNLIIAQARSKA